MGVWILPTKVDIYANSILGSMRRNISNIGSLLWNKLHYSADQKFRIAE